MPLPDPYRDEPATQLDADDYASWRAAQEAANAWQKIADQRKERLIKALGNNHAGMIGDEKVLTYRYTSSYATARLVKENESLAQHFYRQETKDVFNMEEFRSRHPEIAEKYRVRQFRVAE